MKRRDFALAGLAPLVARQVWAGSTSTVSPLKKQAVSAMKRAAVYMDEVVSYRGGYVWSYVPDLSQTFGEMEAYRTMCWIQPPGTPSVGHVYLDAYHATGDERYYQAAVRTALALVAAQHSAGGWNYIHDFAGTESLKKWYATIGKNGWRLEEFQHYYGNATFDDAGTAVASQVLLRMYVEKGDHRFWKPLCKAIDFVVNAQYGAAYGIANGGWPQRYPHYAGSVSSMTTPYPGQVPEGARHGMEDGDYTVHVTFNDDVMGENIKFLLMCVTALGRVDLIDNVVRAMDCMRRMQQPSPQAGWGLQHLATSRLGRPAGAPAGARSYEPRSLATHTTQTNVNQMFNFFQLTGDRKFLQRVPEAIAWLKTCPLPADATTVNTLLAGRTHPTFIELGTNDGLYVHRYGSNINNGGYFFDKDYTNTISHYSSGRAIDIDGLQASYDELAGMSDRAVREMVAASPLKARGIRDLPTYYAIEEVTLADLFAGAVKATPEVTDDEASELIADLGTKNYWTTAATAIVNPYIGDGPTAPYTGTAYRSKHVGDVYDTSPYPASNPPDIAPYVVKENPQHILTSDWIACMGSLIAYIKPVTG